MESYLLEAQYCCCSAVGNTTAVSMSCCLPETFPGLKTAETPVPLLPTNAATPVLKLPKKRKVALNMIADKSSAWECLAKVMKIYQREIHKNHF